MASIYQVLGGKNISSTGGRLQGSVKYHAEGYTDLGVLEKAFGTGTVPGLGSVHPDFPGMICKDFDISPVAGFDDLYLVTFKYEQIAPLPSVSPVIPIPDKQPGEINYVELSMAVRAEFTSAWRSKPVVPSRGDPGESDNPDEPLGPEADIEGTPVDAAGVPTSVIRRYQDLTLTETVNEPDFERYSLYRYTRNSTTFQGGKTGYVLYRGAMINRVGVSVYQVAHQFVYDEWAHLIQQPALNQDGKPYLTDIDPANPTLMRAKKVYWIQPFPDKANHNLISNNF